MNFYKPESILPVIDIILKMIEEGKIHDYVIAGSYAGLVQNLYRLKIIPNDIDIIYSSDTGIGAFCQEINSKLKQNKIAFEIKKEQDNAYYKINSLLFHFLYIDRKLFEGALIEKIQIDYDNKKINFVSPEFFFAMFIKKGIDSSILNSKYFSDDKVNNILEKYSD